MRELMLAGMNVARFNFSHGDYETHEKRFRVIERLRKELDMPIATLLDTKGPEIRLGKFVDDKPVEIHDGELAGTVPRAVCNFYVISEGASFFGIGIIVIKVVNELFCADRVLGNEHTVLNQSASICVRSCININGKS